MVQMTPAMAGELRTAGVTILSACTVNEVAYEPDDLNHGAFSYFLARGLEGAAADANGAVTCDGLYRYVHHEVSTWASGRGLVQTPWRLSEGVGDAVLVGRSPVPRSPDAVGPLRLPRFHFGSVVPPEFYVDRESELGDALGLIDSGQSFLLVGDRRSGKTSFIRKLIHQFDGSGPAIPPWRSI